MISRKRMLKILAGLPLFGGLAAGATLGMSGCANTSTSDTSERNLFEEMGINTLINGRGTLTFLSGSLMRPEVVEAIRSTSHEFANLREVQDKVGERMAELLQCEGAMVTSGAAGALTLGTAAAITGMDEELIRGLPDIPGPRREVIIQSNHRYGYDHAVRNTGIKMVEVESAQEMEDAINENTVMGLFFNAASQFGGFEDFISDEEFVEICKRNQIVSFIDAAADVPPVENLFKFTEMGFDLVTFSGGKAIRGPQSAGLLFGRKDLIEAAKLNHNPNSDTIGRGLKVNKEEIFGMYVALETYLNMDHEAQWQEWMDWVDRIAESAETVDTVEGEAYVNDGPANQFPNLRLRWDSNSLGITPGEASDALKNGTPSIEVSGNSEFLNVSVAMLKPEHVDIVAIRIKEVLETA